MFKNLTEDKKKLWLVIGATVVLIIAIVVVIVFLVKENNVVSGIGNINPDAKKVKNEYEQLNGTVSEDDKTYPYVDISSNNILRYTDVTEILDIFDNSGDAVIYFGYSSCLYCRSVIQVLCDTASSTSLDKIYYLNVEEVSHDDNYNKLVDILGEAFIIDVNGQKEIYSPLVLFVVNGNVVSYNKGTLFSQEDPYVELDDYQVEGLSEIYRYGINDVLDSMRIKNQ